jgi:hypothetical protein
VLAEGTQEAACIPVEVHQTQGASAAAETPGGVQILAGESLAVHHSQLAKEAGVAVIPTEEEGAGHSAVVVEGEQHYSLHLDDPQTQEAEHLVVDLPFAVGRRALLMGRRARRR